MNSCIIIHRIGCSGFAYDMNIYFLTNCQDSYHIMCFSNQIICGPNTLKDTQGNCHCLQGFVESANGSASTEPGCIGIIDFMYTI